ncbi:MAG TPA: DUF402 domain-containing protein [Anaerolineales bacterium]|jgi:hypothetical protein
MITVRKRDPHGQVTWEYQGQLLDQEVDFIRLEARFNRADMPFQGILLKQGDRFLETFYTARWYNLFEIHDRDTDALKGWYCNIGCPAVWDAPAVISYIDLFLDLWVTPAGVQSVLDEDEFNAAGLDAPICEQALRSLSELQALFASGLPYPSL